MKENRKIILKWLHIKHNIDTGADVFLLYYEDGTTTVEFSEYCNSKGSLKFSIGGSNNGTSYEILSEDSYHCILRWEDHIPFNTVIENLEE